MSHPNRPVPAAEDRCYSLIRGALLSVTEGKLHLCHSGVELPAPFRSAAPPFPLNRATVPGFRRQVHQVAVAQGFGEERRQNLMTAAGEAAMNAVTHGGGGEARLFAADGGAVQVWIADHGGGGGAAGADMAPPEEGAGTDHDPGYGWWLILRSADRIWLCVEPASTTVVLQQEREPSEPVWRHPR